MAAATGAKVGIAEEYRVGGTCVIRGCIPKKLLTYAAHFREDFEDARGYGWEVEPQGFSWERLIANKDREIDRLNGVYLKILENAGVRVHTGHAVVQDAHTVRIGHEVLTAQYIAIATGSHPNLPNVPGIEHALTSNEIFHLAAQPKDVTIVGGGYIALEFAGIFNGLGSATHVLYRGEQILRNFDHDVREHACTEIVKKGVHIEHNIEVLGVEKQARGLQLRLSDGSKRTTDIVLYATGRSPNTRGLGLEHAGVETDSMGAVVVDSYSQSSVSSIYAIGDVTDRIQLTPVALHEAMALVATLFKGIPTPVDHSNVPAAVFCQPPVAGVGLNEEQARLAFAKVEIYKTSFRPLKHTLSGRAERTFMKLIVDGGTQRVVGAHMVGSDAPEIIQGVAIAVKLGATKAQFDQTLGIHPTAAEEFVTLREQWRPAAHAKHDLSSG
jgi:glutathione reductase (NADPH)